jgi:hypothetical protein
MNYLNHIKITFLKDHLGYSYDYYSEGSWVYGAWNIPQKQHDWLQTIKSKNDALLNFKHKDKYVRKYCEAIMKNAKITYI